MSLKASFIIFDYKTQKTQRRKIVCFTFLFYTKKRKHPDFFLTGAMTSYMYLIHII